MKDKNHFNISTRSNCVTSKYGKSVAIIFDDAC